MKEAYKDLILLKNETDHHFEMVVGNDKAIIVYKQSGNTITLIHTEVDSALEGQGAATAIIEKTLDYIEKNHFKLIPLCPLVVAYIEKHPEWKHIEY